MGKMEEEYPEHFLIMLVQVVNKNDLSEWCKLDVTRIRSFNIALGRKIWFLSKMKAKHQSNYDGINLKAEKKANCSIL